MTQIALGLAAAAAAAAALARSRAPQPGGRRSGQVSVRAYWSLVALLFTAHVARTTVTSVFTLDKAIIAWESYCVSTGAFVLGRLAYLGVLLVTMVPAAHLWSQSGRDCLPAVDPCHPDGRCGVGSYVSFLQAWATLILVLVVVGSVTWTRYMLASSGSVPGAYVVNLAVGTAVGTAFAGRLVLRGIDLRRAYVAARSALGGTWAEVEAKGPAADPTIPFLGEHWWNLVAVVLGALATAWALMDWMGAAAPIQAVVAS